MKRQDDILCERTVTVGKTGLRVSGRPAFRFKIPYISSELPELLRMSDRIAVMCEGTLTGIMDIKDASQEEILQLATLRK